MDKLPFRQVHLDFHTSECMPDVGGEFSEENFRQALTEGHISSITLFGKCHHGWSYFPSKVNAMHPTLKTNLLDRQLKVCEELGVRAQIYISAGLDEHLAVTHPEFCNVQMNGSNLLGAHWHGLCLNNDDYLDLLRREVVEVVETFRGRFEGVFLDICRPSLCVCPKCIESMLSMGLDPNKKEDVQKHVRKVYFKYTSLITNAVKEIAPELAVFHNCGIDVGDREWAYTTASDHFEIESLPTGGWGYDHFPLHASYLRSLGREFTGMTGKFHKSWGEFGGYKHPNALRYETGLSLATGAKCCIGDQLHPSGKFDLSTYRLMGAAYAEVEQKEEWCHDVTAVTDIAVYSADSDSETVNCLIGANRMLLEGKYLYDIIDDKTPFDGYKLVIFPDNVVFDCGLKAKTDAFLEAGGSVLLSGFSGTPQCEKGTECGFFRDFGLKFLGENPHDATYMIPAYNMEPNGIAPYLMYEHGYSTVVSDETVETVAQMQDSYFNRSYRRFCSHANTPNDPSSFAPGAVLSGKIGYIGWNIFHEYARNGAYHQKRLVCDMLDRLLGERKTLTTDLQSNGVVTLMEQKNENRLVCHLLYAVTKKRGDIEVIEDAIPITGTRVTVRLDHKPGRVYTAPDGNELGFDYGDGVLSFTVPSFTLHGMVVIDK